MMFWIGAWSLLSIVFAYLAGAQHDQFGSIYNGVWTVICLLLLFLSVWSEVDRIQTLNLFHKLVKESEELDRKLAMLKAEKRFLEAVVKSRSGKKEASS